MIVNYWKKLCFCWNFIWKILISTLYKNVRKIRFVLFPKTLIECSWCMHCSPHEIIRIECFTFLLLIIYIFLLCLSASAYNVLVAASALLGFGSAGLGVLSVTYIDENVPKKMMPLYIGNEQLRLKKKIEPLTFRVRNWLYLLLVKVEVEEENVVILTTWNTRHLWFRFSLLHAQPGESRLRFRKLFKQPFILKNIMVEILLVLIIVEFWYSLLYRKVQI